MKWFSTTATASAAQTTARSLVSRRMDSRLSLSSSILLDCRPPIVRFASELASWLSWRRISASFDLLPVAAVFPTTRFSRLTFRRAGPSPHLTSLAPLLVCPRRPHLLLVPRHSILVMRLATVYIFTSPQRCSCRGGLQFGDT